MTLFARCLPCEPRRALYTSLQAASSIKLTELVLEYFLNQIVKSFTHSSLPF